MLITVVLWSLLYQLFAVFASCRGGTLITDLHPYTGVSAGAVNHEKERI